MRKILMIASASIIGFCFVSVIRTVRFKNAYLLILIMASIYFGVLYKTKGKDNKKEEGDEPPFSKLSSEFSGEQERFKKLDERGTIY